MKKNRSSISRGKSYREIGEFWDVHDLSNFWDRTEKMKFDVDIKSEVVYYALDRRLSEQIQSIAQKRGVTADTLVNLLLQEKLQEQKI